ncbi:MAG: hypothetical protein JNM29_09600 [Candidatus Odyssella sp.]|nr:hypothetical protein [Candidatus Odyssella sp.]
MDALIDVSFFAAGLACFAAIGWPVCAAIPAEVRGRFWAAPVLGLALFGVVATLAYRGGVPLPYLPLVCLFFAAVACALPGVRRRAAPAADARAAAISAVAVVAVGLLVLSPKWIGGHQFAAFQGNHYDQATYIANASAFAKLSYGELARLSPANVLANTYNHFAGEQLGSRPAVGFVLAALRAPFFDTTFEAAYAYLALLQALTFFAAVFVLRAVFAVSPIPALLLSAALAAGTYLQLIFDINAWSQLAATPLVLVLTALVALAFGRTARAPLFFPLTAGGAGVCYVYPEIGPIAASAVAGAALGWLLIRDRRPWIEAMRVPALAGAAALVVCVPYWRGTLGSLLIQAQAIGRGSYPTEWFFYYYRFLFGRNEHAVDLVLNSAIPAQTALAAAMALPVDFALGALGLYFLSPEPGAGRAAGLLAACAAVIALIAACIGAGRALRAANPAGFAFVCGAVLALAVPASMLASGNLWPGGKGVLMAAPLLYFALISPLLVAMPRRRRILPLLLVCAHLAFAFERPVAAARPNGIHRSFPPYPSIMEKAAHDWDLPRHKSRLRACSAVALDIAHPVLDRVAQTFVVDLGLRWYSRRPLRSYFEQGTDLGRQPPIADADCVLTDGAAPPGEQRAHHRIGLRRGP